MKTRNKNLRVLLSAVSVLLLIMTVVMASFSFSVSADNDEPEVRGTLTQTIKKTDANTDLLKTFTSETNYYIVVRHKHMGGSHYAYTDALAETNGSDDRYKEYNFYAGSSMVLLTAVDKGETVEIYEDTLFKSNAGVIRDPDVSSDGKRVLFSYKATTNDDFHIYEMVIETKEMTQLTFGSGKSDIEAKYLPNGNIVFNSNRCVQTVDCWITPVQNLYIMNGDGTNAIRVGYDQVHTTYPTVTSDGRVIYTRWDYNDRTQMWVQGVFQMFQDGSNQTELYGNNSNYPTTLLHTREIPGSPGKYISIASGHHVYQQGKVVIVDTNVDRNDPDAIKYATKDGASFGKPNNIDGGSYTTDGAVYKYPYAFNESEFLVASSTKYDGSNTKFNIYLMNTKGAKVVIAEGASTQAASQIVPVKGGDPFNRPSSLNYSTGTGTYYVADVYVGEGMEGVERGTVKYLRVVEIEYRTTSLGATFQSGSGTGDPFSPIATGNGAWDIKAVLGIVPVEEDGSCMFKVPADTPIYFQLLDKDGQMIQTMRSWSTLMSGETYSCVGCHEDNNTTPLGNANVTLAMKKGVQDLQPDTWMGQFEEYEGFDPYKDDAIGFSYLNTVQRVLDKNCVTCHSNTDESISKIDATMVSTIRDDLKNANYLIKPSDVWAYTVDGGKSGTAYAPFGAITSSQKDINTPYSGNKITLTKSINVTKYDKEACAFTLWLEYSGTITVKVNGTAVYTSTKVALGEESVVIENKYFDLGENTVTVEVDGGTKYVNLSLSASVPGASEEVTIFNKGATWTYKTSTSSSSVSSDWYKDDFDDSSWKTGSAPFGSFGSTKTTWNDSNGDYIWLRTEFTIDSLDKYKGGDLYFDIFYDDHCTIYINETEVFYNSGYNTSYEKKIAQKKVDKVLKEGVNTIAVKLGDTGGGHFFDTGIFVLTKPSANLQTTAVFSLEGAPISASRMMRTYPLSYLVLTGSKPSTNGNQESGLNWIGDASNSYTNWISSMSDPVVQKPYKAGSSKSAIIEKLASGHCGTISDEELAVIKCWIDLTVPCHGEYDECNTFNSAMQRQYTETVNKRAYYDAIDRYTKLSIAGVTSQKEVKITYEGKNETTEATGKGLATLYVDGKYAAGDKVTVTLPEGEKYVFVGLNARAGEVLMYLPTGTWTYKFENLTTCYPNTMNNVTSYSYRENTITARIPTADELAQTRNLAANIYDLSSAKDAYPHATGSSATSGAQFAVRNAIDGFYSNQSAAAKWPANAWKPSTSEKSSEIKIDFGRSVVVEELVVYITGDATHYVTATVVLSDGTEMEINLRDTDEGMSFDLGGKTTTSITIKNLVKADESKAAAISEVKVFGHEA